MRGFKQSTVGAVFVIQIKSGGQGLNLQEATRVYITSPTWNPSTELQAISRAHRTGQTQIVHVRRLIYIDQGDCPTIEHSMLALQQSKAEMAERVLGDKGSTRMVHEVKSAPGMSEIKKIFSIR
jgi:SNF2 family DNA or RNA helicase